MCLKKNHAKERKQKITRNFNKAKRRKNISISLAYKTVNSSLKTC